MHMPYAEHFSFLQLWIHMCVCVSQHLQFVDICSASHAYDSAHEQKMHHDISVGK